MTILSTMSCPAISKPASGRSRRRHYVNNHDETFLLVRSGHGTLTVNGLDYRLRPNTLINLGPFHRYRYLPDDGEALEIAESRMNSGTYVYLVANPYMKFESLRCEGERRERH